MLYSKIKILQEYNNGNIIYKSELNSIQEHTQNQSIDIHLGQWLFFPQITSNNNIFLQLEKHIEFLNTSNTSQDFEVLEYGTWVNLKKCKSIVVKAGTCFLSHSEEFIGTKARSNIHPSFVSRSTTARDFLFHTFAGHGDVGYINKWTMEWKAEMDIELSFNQKIAQILFKETTNSGDYTRETGNYQKSNNIEEIMSSWDKTDILSKNMKEKFNIKKDLSDKIEDSQMDVKPCKSRITEILQDMEIARMRQINNSQKMTKEVVEALKGWYKKK